MLITASARDLAKAASAAAEMSKLKASQTTIPILGNLLVTATNATASFAGCDLEGYMESTVVAETNGATDRITVDGRIAKLLAGLPPAATAKITAENGAVTLQCGRSRYRIDTLAADEFPPAFTADGAVELVLSGDERRRLFATPASCISDEETRYYLRGLNLKITDARLVACATTGHQLIRTSIEAPPSCELPPEGVIVPANACAAISKMDGCTVKISDRVIEARTDTCFFSHRLIDATFPSYERVISAPSGNSVEVDRRELLGALRRLLCVASQEKTVTKIAVMEWDNDELSLSLARQPDIAADVLPAITGNSGKTGLAVGIFIDLLSNISSERVLLDTSDPGSAVRITLPSDDDFIAIQMPCRV